MNTSQRHRPGSAPDPSLIAALEDTGLIAPGAGWVPLTGGRTNRIWSVGTLICKLYAKAGATPLFANDPAAELRALKELAGTGLAPEVVHSGRVRVGPYIVYRAVKGRVLTAPDAELMGALYRLHTRPAPTGFSRWPGRDPDPVALGRELLRQVADSPEKAALESAEPPHVALLPPGRMSLLHRDAVAANAISTERGVVLIDWQCPATGDPVEDLAIALSPAMQSLYGTGSFDPCAVLSAYPDPSVRDRYRRLVSAFAFRMAAYCLWRVANGDADYAPGFHAEYAALSEGQ